MVYSLRNISSLIKSLFISIILFLLSPLVFLVPRYSSYIFVLTTGRSGSGSLSSIFQESLEVNSFHEPYPILNNSFNFSSKINYFWIKFQFYFIKVPLIICSNLNRKNIYLETNHLFVKAFSSFAIKFFGSKIKLIHLVRPTYLVAKSMYEIGKIPGDKFGNKWYMNPNDINNMIDFNMIFELLDDEDKYNYEDLYKCVWYWHEVEARIKLFKKDNSVSILELETNELDNTDKLLNKINSYFDLNISNFSIANVDKNYKSDEKRNLADVKLVQEKSCIFKQCLLRYNE